MIVPVARLERRLVLRAGLVPRVHRHEGGDDQRVDGAVDQRDDQARKDAEDALAVREQPLLPHAHGDRRDVLRPNARAAVLGLPPVPVEPSFRILDLSGSRHAVGR